MTGVHVLSEIRDNNHLAMHHDYWGQLFEEITFALYTGILQHGDVAIDCGVNIGEHTRAMSRLCGQSGKVYSIEAAPKMMEKAKGSLLGLSNIEWVPRAAWDKSNETKTFYFFPNEDGLSSLQDREDRSVSEEIQVTTATLDSIVSEHISLIKLDIEGAEYHALLGAERIMSDSHPIIVLKTGGRHPQIVLATRKTTSFDYFMIGTTEYLQYQACRLCPRLGMTYICLGSLLRCMQPQAGGREL